LTEDDILHYDGTLRVQHLDQNKNPVAKDGEYLLASGDLYARHVDSVRANESRPPNGIPIFPRKDYRYYLCLKDIPDGSVSQTGFSLILESHAFVRETERWDFKGDFRADMKWTFPPPDYPFDYLEGDVFETTGKRNGRVTMAWVSDYLRRAIIQIDMQPGVDRPSGDDDYNWEKVFKEADWRVEAVPLENTMAQPRKQIWTQGELAEQLPALCRSGDLDAVWSYYLLCVDKIDRVERGITYYFGLEDDPDQNFREVAVLAGDYEFRRPLWGSVHGTLQANKLLYFRVAVHEIGHAMSLEHNTADNGFMNTTEQLALDAKGTFSENTPRYSFWLGDQQRLRHWPDIIVRPGTLIDSQRLPATTVPVFPANGIDDKPTLQALEKGLKGISFTISTLPGWNEVPVGAPVRLRLELGCIPGWPPISVPNKLSLKSGYITVTVVGPDSSVRGFSALLNHMDAAALEPLAQPEKEADSTTSLHDPSRGSPTKTKSGSITLLHDDGGNPLFPHTGKYEVKVQLLWRPGRTDVQIEKEATLLIAPVEDQDHCDAARAVLDTPDFLLVLALADDSSGQAIEALRLALRSKTLRPHFAFINFKLLSQSAASKPADLNAACEFLKTELELGSAVLSTEEIADSIHIIEETFSKWTDAHLIENVLELLEKKALAANADARTTEQIDAIQEGLRLAMDSITTALNGAATEAAKAVWEHKDKLGSAAALGTRLPPMTNDQLLASLKAGWTDGCTKAVENLLRKDLNTLQKNLKANKYQRPADRTREKIKAARIEAFLETKDWDKFFIPKK